MSTKSVIPMALMCVFVVGIIIFSTIFENNDKIREPDFSGHVYFHSEEEQMMFI
ncbi:hypothetical protein [Evansella tamaricis]|uniref:Uncharacterized protein n=1 Tax=Evansella tamaricis TaxID=2069301 RepID=A0ABS6JED3_9BACI|nr:hypothetical protein [Evansella tamaricis]MBU9712032.1 hypothetical protein [Evansella tamaricis]